MPFLPLSLAAAATGAAQKKQEEKRRVAQNRLGLEERKKKMKFVFLDYDIYGSLAEIKNHVTNAN